MTRPKIPLNLFGIPFGLAGLGEAWAVLASEQHAPALVGVAAPFASLALIVPVLLASDGLFPHAATPARVITDVFIVLTVLLGGWFTGQWILGPVDLDRFHPGYFLPTVAGGLIASDGAALVGQLRLAEILLGLGVLSWIVLGSLILARLLFRPLLPTALLPTLAIEVAPAAVASLAWFGIRGVRIDMVAAFRPTRRRRHPTPPSPRARPLWPQPSPANHAFHRPARAGKECREQECSRARSARA